MELDCDLGSFASGYSVNLTCVAGTDCREIYDYRKSTRLLGANVCADAKNGAPGAIPARDLTLRSRIHEPIVFNSYEKA